MESKACMVTGHRTIDPWRVKEVKAALKQEILRAIEDGYTRFISGFAQGADLLFAGLVAELKEQYPIQLEAAIPYRNRLNCKNKEFQRIIAQCDVIGVGAEKYSPQCYFERNRYMVQQSGRVIAVYDGREYGGTFATLCYAKEACRDVRVIFPEQL